MDHFVQVAVPAHRKLQPDPEAVQRRIPGTDKAHAGSGTAHAAHVVGVLR
jgi:hypothetical protein